MPIFPARNASKEAFTKNQVPIYWQKSQQIRTIFGTGLEPTVPGSNRSKPGLEGEKALQTRKKSKKVTFFGFFAKRSERVELPGKKSGYAWFVRKWPKNAQYSVFWGHFRPQIRPKRSERVELPCSGKWPKKVSFPREVLPRTVFPTPGSSVSDLLCGRRYRARTDGTGLEPTVPGGKKSHFFRLKIWLFRAQKRARNFVKFCRKKCSILEQWFHHC